MDRRIYIVLMVALVMAALVVGRSITDSSGQPQAGLDLYEAIRTSRLEIVERYLAQGGDPNEVISDSTIGNATPLKVAIAGQRERIALALLGAGGRIDLAEMELSDVSAAGMAEVLSYLLVNEEPADVSTVKAAVDTAVAFGHFDAVATLLGYLHARDAPLGTLLWDAMNLSIGRGFDDIARLLLENGAPPSGAALRAAGLRSSPGMVRYLLELGADPFERYRDPIAHIRPQGRDGYATIDFVWEAYQQGTPAQRNAATFKMFDLLAAGVTPDQADMRSIAADGDQLLSQMDDPAEKLVVAAEWGFYDAIRELLAARAVGDEEVWREATIVAIRARWDDIARLLLREGASPRGGALHVAVRSSSPGMVRYLLSLGADPNELVNGYAPVHYWFRDDPAAPDSGARGGGNPEILHELIVGGADVCWLVEHRSELAEQDFSYSVLWNSAPECWPEQQ